MNAAAELTEDRVTTPRSQGAMTGRTQKVPRKYPESTQKIIDSIRENPFVTRMELAQIVGMTSDGVKKMLNRLKSSHIVRRVGPDNGGHWEVDGETRSTESSSCHGRVEDEISEAGRTAKK